MRTYIFWGRGKQGGKQYRGPGQILLYVVIRREYMLLYNENTFFGVAKKKSEIVSRARTTFIICYCIMGKYVILYDENTFFGVGKKKEGNSFQSQAKNVFCSTWRRQHSSAIEKATLYMMRTCFLKGTKKKNSTQSQAKIYYILSYDENICYHTMRTCSLG